jgi:3-hydroxyisobutyrate dehydrogenase-like beta-hydroxyacid dehydrogenase
VEGYVRIGFLGLGKMGCALVPHLLNAGHDVTVWNRNIVIAEKFAAQGAEVARSAVDAVTKCEVVFTLLLNDNALEDVLFGGGVLDAMPKGAIHVSVSTISVALAKRLTVEHAKRGLRHVGAPVFGRPNVAAEGKLWVVAGGAKDALEKVRPLLEIYSRGITVVSEVGRQLFSCSDGCHALRSDDSSRVDGSFSGVVCRDGKQCDVPFSPL